MPTTDPAAAAPDAVLNAMTVDLEDWYQVSAFEHLVERSDWDSQPQRADLGTNRLLDLFDRHGVHATFFVLGWVAERQPELVAAVQARGHEIASHGHEHRLVYEMDPEAFRQDLTRAAEAIRRACGAAVKGFRAPSFSMTLETPWAWDVLRAEGYKYSSSVFPVRHDRYGIPSFPRHPVRLAGADGQTLWEFPMTTLRVLGRNVPAAGGGWLRALPQFVTRRALRAANKRGHPGVVYVHPWELDPDQPIMQGATRRAILRHRLNLKRTGARLEKLLRRFRFGTMADVLAAVDGPVVPLPPSTGRSPRRRLTAASATERTPE